MWNKGWLAGFALAIVTGAPGLAQDIPIPVKADAPALQGLAPMTCPRSDVRLSVLGDSLADGLWGALFRASAHCGNIDILRLTQVSDGLAKTPPEDWAARLDAAGGDDVQDVIIVQIGANDLTAIRADRSRIAFGADGWDDAYAGRIAALAEALEAAGDKLLWVGLPTTGEPRYEPGYRTVDTLIETALADRSAEYVAIRDLSRFGADGFVMNAEVDGAVRQLRAPDKVHFTELGYDVLASALAPVVARAMVRKDSNALFRTTPLQ